MIFKRVEDIEGAKIISNTRYEDSRGTLTRIWDRELFSNSIANFAPAQINLVKIYGKGTLKGLHFQTLPSAEAKVVICISGEIFDVMVDVRNGSSTFGNCFGITLNSSQDNSVFVPANVAHGMQNLSDYAEVLYIHGDFYDASLELGINALDPSINIDWPLRASNMSKKDLGLPSLYSLMKGL